MTYLRHRPTSHSLITVIETMENPVPEKHDPESPTTNCKAMTKVDILEMIPSGDTSLEGTQHGRGNVDHANTVPRWVRLRQKIREPLAEFFGVFTLIIFGDGVVAQVVLSKGQKGDYQSINWGYPRDR